MEREPNTWKSKKKKNKQKLHLNVRCFALLNIHPRILILRLLSSMDETKDLVCIQIDWWSIYRMNFVNKKNETKKKNNLHFLFISQSVFLNAFPYIILTDLIGERERKREKSRLIYILRFAFLDFYIRKEEKCDQKNLRILFKLSYMHTSISSSIGR